VRAGDVVWVDFGVPEGSEPGFRRPAIVVTADNVLVSSPRTLRVVPLTSNVDRRLPSEVRLPPIDGLGRASAAHVHNTTLVSRGRIDAVSGPITNVGPAVLAQLRSVLADLLDIG
jgi:mRNA interferase MazF